MSENSKPWYKKYEENVPHHIEIEEVPLYKILDDSATKYPNKTAINFYNWDISYNELLEKVETFKTALYELGIRKGDRIALMLPNTPHYIISYFATLKLGGIVVQVNPLYSKSEIEFILKDSESKALITLDLFLEKILEIKEKVPTKIFIVARVSEFLNFPLNILISIKNIFSKIPPIPKDFELFSKLLSTSPKTINVEISPKDDVAVLQYTGGTTGRPKGAMLTHYNLFSNVKQLLAWTTNVDHTDERTLTVIPLFHVYSMTVAMNYTISVGGSLVLIPKFELKEIIKAIEKHKITNFPGVPVMYNVINNYKDIKKHNLSSIKFCLSGAAPLPVQVKQQFEKLTGAKLIEGYGLSEASPVTHANPIYGENRDGSIGLPLPSTDAKVVDLKTGEELPPGKEGELIIKGPQVMKGYWRNEEETKETIKDGWLYTGDIAKMDEDGYFYIVDRKKDMIIVRGFNVYPRNVEEVIYKHPKVKEAAVIGIKKPEIADEVVKAYIVIKEGEDLTKDEILKYLRENLAPYEVPREIEFTNEIPKSLIGKPLRRILREREEKSNI
ncbi:MAG: long-chain fatty acid--CoA ligase [candidate division WOR-3 bacterium]|nr:long-chain fatty acid--CoA ligase [candidate division WOR-3 bacterium]